MRETMVFVLFLIGLALTVGPWVSDLLAFTGARTSDAKARSSARSARKNQDRADNIHWS